jgi:MFS family permease
MTGERTEYGKPYILLLCCLGQFMVVLDVSVVNVALPAIRADLGFDLGSLQWVVNAYTVLFAGFLLLGGRAADLLSRRTVFSAGFLLFAGASLIGGFAPGALTLVLARGVQGLGAAVLAPATLAILTGTFTGPGERGRALGTWGAVGGAGGALGVLVGGLATELLDWRWVFFVNVPIGAVAVLAARRFIPSGQSTRDRKLDVPGAVTGSAGLVALVYAIVTAGEHAWLRTGTLLPLASGVALLGAFLVIESRLARDPLLPLDIFTRPGLAAANSVVFLLGFAMLAMWYFVTLHLQQVLGYPPIRAGLAFLPMVTVLALLAGDGAAHRAVRRGPRARRRDGAHLRGHAAVRADAGRWELSLRRAPGNARRGRRPRVRLRGGDRRGDRRGRARRGGARVRAGEHRAPGRRLARALGTRDGRGRPRREHRLRRGRDRRLPPRVRPRGRRRGGRCRARAHPRPQVADTGTRHVTFWSPILLR